MGLAASALLPMGVPSFIALCFAAVGIWSTFGVFWTLPTSFLTGTAAAAGLAFINSFGALGGFTGPYLVGLLRAQTGTFTGSLLFLSVMVLAVALLSALLPVQMLRRGQ